MLVRSDFGTDASAQTLTSLANGTRTFKNRVTQSGPLVVDASIQFIDVRDFGTIDSLPKHTPHDV